VIVGYPEKVDVSPSPEFYNSSIVVDSDGETIANYRKSFLYYNDDKWALQGPDGFFGGSIEGLGNVAMGTCQWPTTSFERKLFCCSNKIHSILRSILHSLLVLTCVFSEMELKYTQPTT